eukprot:scaffold193964_cov24-Tisochrysis_lutea.AAC.1
MSETLVTAHQPALTTRRRTPRPECLTCAHICAEAPSRTGPARIEPSHGLADRQGGDVAKSVNFSTLTAGAPGLIIQVQTDF